MKRQLVPLAFTSLLALSLAACSGSGSAPAAPGIPGLDPNAKPAAQAHPAAVNAVPGPELKGRWKSACAPISGGKFVRLTYEFKAKQVVDRAEDIYDSASCDHITDFKEQVGTYRYVQKYGDDVYDVEFNLPSSDGWQKLNENIRYQDNGLTVSYRANGSGVKPDIALIAVDANDKPLPTPTPSPSPSPSPSTNPSSTSSTQPAALTSVCKNGEVKAQMEAVNVAYVQGYDNCNIGSVKQIPGSTGIEKYAVGLTCDNGRPTLDVVMEPGSDGKCVTGSASFE